MQVEVLALVEIDRQNVEAHAFAAIQRLLDPQGGAEPGAVGTDNVGEEIAGRERGAEGRDRDDQRNAGGKPRGDSVRRRCNNVVSSRKEVCAESRGILI
jgi:hypothetical protein